MMAPKRRVLVDLWLSPKKAAVHLLEPQQLGGWVILSIGMCFAACFITTTVAIALYTLLSISMVGPIGGLMAASRFTLELTLSTTLALIIAFAFLSGNWIIFVVTKGIRGRRNAFFPAMLASIAAAAPVLLVPFIRYYLFVLAMMFLSGRVLRHLSGTRLSWRFGLQLLYAIALVWALHAAQRSIASIYAFASLGPNPQSTQTIGAGITLERLDRFARIEGKYPLHPIEMVPGPHYFPALLFIADGSETTTQDITIGSMTFEEFLAADANTQKHVANEMAASTQYGVPFRFGDYIYTAPGVDPIACPPQLWLFILLPSPSVNGQPQPTTDVIIGTSGGRVLEMTLLEVQQELTAQNQLRERIGLSALLDPISDDYAASRE